MPLRHVKRGFAALVLVAALATTVGAAAPDPPPAAEILERVRIFQLSQHQRLEGRIRNRDRVIPFTLEIDRGRIRYHLKDPPETLSVDLSSSAVAGGNDLTAPIRGTDITLEDLSMKFLHWDRVELAGEQSVIAGRPCWRLKVYAPSRQASSYGMVMIWAEQSNGALLRVEAFGWDGKAAKRFEVRSIQRSDNGWLLKQMRIQELEGTRSRDRTPTYLEIEKPD